MAKNDLIRQAIKKKLPAVTIDDTLHSAIKTMTDADVSALVVISDGELVGIITEMDLMHGVTEHSDLAAVKVGSLMTACELITSTAANSPCVQLDEEESALNAIRIMNHAGVHHLLVSDANGKAVGMVAAKDILKLMIS